MRVLDVGSGMHPYESEGDEITHLDKYPFPHVEEVWDVEKKDMWMWTAAFDRIVARHVLEHLNEPSEFLHKCWSWLRMDGELELVYPHKDSDEAYDNPDHKHYFSKNIIEEYLKYPELNDRFRFEVIRKEIIGSQVFLWLKKIKCTELIQND